MARNKERYALCAMRHAFFHSFGAAFNIQSSIANEVDSLSFFFCDFHIAQNRVREKSSGEMTETMLKEDAVSEASAIVRPQWRIVRLYLLS